MSNQSRELAEKDVSRSIEVLQVYRDSIKIAMADLEEASSKEREAEERRKRKASSKARRQAKVASK
jgi:hypothetical protein